MIIDCTEVHKDKLIDFLEKDRIYNTFILSDIFYYGFKNKFQQIYMTEDEKGNCVFVYLKFHNNLIVSGEIKNIDFNFINKIVKNSVDVVMGKSELIQSIQATLNYKNSKCNKKKLYVLSNEKKLCAENIAKVADLSSLDSIHTFLNSIKEFGNIYSSKEMIKNRLSSNEGDHYIYEKDDEIIAHGNSAAKNKYSCMIGGVATKKEYRHKNYAKLLVSQISRDLIKDGIKPCLFSDKDLECSFFKDIGFELYGYWGTLLLNKK